MRILHIAAFAAGCLAFAMSGDARAQTVTFTLANKLPGGEVVRAWITNTSLQGGQEGAMPNDGHVKIETPFPIAEGDNEFKAFIRNEAATANYCDFSVHMKWTPTPVVGVFTGTGTFDCSVTKNFIVGGRTCADASFSRDRGCDFSFSVR